MRKRLEEAARKEMPDILRINRNYVESFITGFCFGGEWMFEEAIAQVKEWLLQHLPTPDWYSSTGEFVSDFETDMNKLLGGKK